MATASRTLTGISGANSPTDEDMTDDVPPDIFVYSVVRDDGQRMHKITQVYGHIHPSYIPYKQFRASANAVLQHTNGEIERINDIFDVGLVGDDTLFRYDAAAVNSEVSLGAMLPIGLRGDRVGTIDLTDDLTRRILRVYAEEHDPMMNLALLALITAQPTRQLSNKLFTSAKLPHGIFIRDVCVLCDSVRETGPFYCERDLEISQNAAWCSCHSATTF